MERIRDMELVRMPISKLRANPLNPRTNFGDLAALADSFALNSANPGEPLNPLIAVMDGNVARIVDGERRYRAMKERGDVDECWVYLCDGMSEADAAVSMLATDDKMTLDEMERSRGVQQMLILGVDEEKVEKVARKKCAAALRRTVGHAGGEVVAMTIEQAMAADEFRDDEDDYRAVADAGADSWQYRYRDIVRRRERDARDAAVYDEAFKAEVEVAEKPPKGHALFKSLYNITGEQVRLEGPTWAAARQVLVPPKDRWACWELYAPKRAKSAEEVERTERANAAKRAHAADERRRFEFVAGRLAEGKMELMSRTSSLLSGLKEEHDSAARARFLEKASVGADGAPGMQMTPWDFAVEFAYAAECMCARDAANVMSDGAELWKRREYGRYADLVDALAADGYEASQDELDLAARCRELAAGEAR